MNRTALWEAAKELGRVLLFASVGWAIGYVTNLPENVTTSVGLLVLRAIDKYIHESPQINAQGIAPF